MRIVRKTTEAFASFRATVEVAAAPSATTGYHGTPDPADDYYRVSTRPGIVPTIRLVIPRFGTVELTPAEVAVLLNAVDDTQERAKHPQCYSDGRMVKVSV